MTKEDFIKAYGSEHFQGDRPKKVAMPCNCGESCCTGWAAVRNRFMDLHLHIDSTLLNSLGFKKRPFHHSVENIFEVEGE